MRDIPRCGVRLMVEKVSNAVTIAGFVTAVILAGVVAVLNKFPTAAAKQIVANPVGASIMGARDWLSIAALGCLLIGLCAWAVHFVAHRLVRPVAPLASGLTSADRHWIEAEIAKTLSKRTLPSGISIVKCSNFTILQTATPTMGQPGEIDYEARLHVRTVQLRAAVTTRTALVASLTVTPKPEKED
jgi:hypothetical protein